MTWDLYAQGVAFGAGIMTGILIAFGGFWFLRAFWKSIEANGGRL